VYCSLLGQRHQSTTDAVVTGHPIQITDDLRLRSQRHEYKYKYHYKYEYPFMGSSKHAFARIPTVADRRTGYL